MYSLLINSRVSFMLGTLSSTWLLSWISNPNNAQKICTYWCDWQRSIHSGRASCQRTASRGAFISLPILAECGTPKLKSTLCWGANCQHHLTVWGWGYDGSIFYHLFKFWIWETELSSLPGQRSGENSCLSACLVKSRLRLDRGRLGSLFPLMQQVTAEMLLATVNTPKTV